MYSVNYTKRHRSYRKNKEYAINEECIRSTFNMSNIISEKLMRKIKLFDMIIGS
jgi:hypothetical protein